LKVTVEGEGVPAILRAGEAVVFTGLTLHRSKFNRTDKPRRALFWNTPTCAARLALAALRLCKCRTFMCFQAQRRWPRQNSFKVL
jgi:hypothetical protein